MGGGPVQVPGNVVVPDGGWGWLVVLASFLLQFLTIGITYTFGVMLVALTDPVDGFGMGESETAWIGSIQPCLLYFTGLVSGPLIQRFGWRSVTIFGSVLSSIGFLSSGFAPNIYVLYFTYGGLTGIGNGFMYVTSMVAVQHYFVKRRAMATGIAVSGSGVGTLVFGYLTQYLITELGWRKAMFVESIIILLGVLCGALLRPLPTADTKEQLEIDTEIATDSKTKCPSQSDDHGSIQLTNTLSDDHDDQDDQDDQESGCCKKSVIDCSMYRNPVFVIFCIATTGFAFTLHVPYTFTPDRAGSFGIDTEKAAFLVSIMGISNVCSRLIFGWIADKSEKLRFYMAGIVLISAGVSTCLVPLFIIYPTMVLYSILFGTFTGCYASLFPVILVDLLGVEGIEKSLGQAMATSSFVFLIASPISGLLIDKTGSFDYPFILVGSMGALGGIVYFTMLCFHTWGRTQYEEIGQIDIPHARRRFMSESFS